VFEPVLKGTYKYLIARSLCLSRGLLSDVKEKYNPLMGFVYVVSFYSRCPFLQQRLQKFRAQFGEGGQGMG